MSDEKEIFSKLSKHDYIEENFETIRVEEFKKPDGLIANIGFKLDIAQYYIIACGVLIIVLIHNIYSIILGLILVAIGVAQIISIKDYPTIEIYKDAVVVYTTPSCEKVVCFANEDIAQWSIDSKEGSTSHVQFILNDGRQLTKHTFQLDKAAKALASTMFEKETRIIQQNQTKKENVEFIEKAKKWFSNLLGKK